MPGVRRPTLWFWFFPLPSVISGKLCSLPDLSFPICEVNITITESERGSNAIMSVKIHLRSLSVGPVVRRQKALEHPALTCLPFVLSLYPLMPIPRSELPIFHLSDPPCPALLSQGLYWHWSSTRIPHPPPGFICQILAVMLLLLYTSSPMFLPRGASAHSAGHSI